MARSTADDGSGTLGDPLPPAPIGIMVGETPGIGLRLGEEAFLVEINLSGSRLTRPSLPWPVEPVVGGPRGRTMAPWESTVGRIG